MLGAALLGLGAHKALPAEQKIDGARSVVGQVAGLESLLLALVLGTLVGTSFAFFSMQKTELETLSAQMLLFNQALAEYGPPTTRSGAAETASIPMAPAQATKAYLASLKPETDAQKHAVASANAPVRPNSRQASCAYLSMNSIVCSSAAGETRKRPV